MQKDEKFKVLLVQLPHPSCPDRNVPLAAGYLKAAAFQNKLLDNLDVEILDSAYLDYAGCQMLTDIIISKQPSVIGFSMYLWNVDRTLSIIKRVKALLPTTSIIVGGPEVTKESRAIMSNPYIDIAVFGEGELVFVDLLKYFDTGKPELKDICGIGYRQNRKFTVNKPRQRIMDLNSIPSPYLLGYLNPQEHREMLLFTMKGCMLGCSYCIWTARGKLTAYNLDRLEQELLLARKSGRPVTVSLIDSALNASPVFHDFCRLVERINDDRLLKFNCFLQVDLVDDITASLLRQCGFTSVEVGLQSANSEVLANVNRHVNLYGFLNGVKALRKEGLVAGVDVIVGLPGDSPSNFDATMKFLSDNDLTPTIFQLSVSGASMLSKDLRRFGGVWQSSSPYYLKQTNSFSKNDLQRTFVRYREKYSDLDRIINLNYPALLLSPPLSSDNLQDPASHIQKLDYPIKSILFEKFPNSEEMRKIGRAISYKVGNCLTIVCATDQDDLVESVKLFLEELYSANPYLNCLLLVENQHPHKTKRLLERMVSKVRSTRTFLDSRDELYSQYLPNTHRRTVNVFAVDDRENKRSKFYVKKLCITPSVDKQSLKEEFAGSLNCAFLVDFEAGSRTSFIRDCMDVMISSKREFYFKDWVLQRLWEQEYLRITPAVQPMHCELLIDGNLRIFEKCLDENDLLWDSINRWKMVRKEHEGFNMEEFVLEKAMAALLKVKGVQ